MTTLYDLLDRPEPSPVNAVLLRCAERFLAMSERERANGNHERAGAMKDAAMYLKLQMEEAKCP